MFIHNPIYDKTYNISGIQAFRGIETPALKVEEGFIPNYYSRYFIADIAVGLSIIQQVGTFAGVAMPNVGATMAWHEQIAAVKVFFRYSDYVMHDHKSLSRFYRR